MNHAPKTAPARAARNPIGKTAPVRAARKPIGKTAPTRAERNRIGKTALAWAVVAAAALIVGLGITEMSARQNVRAAEASAQPLPGMKSQYHGFDRYDFALDGCKAWVVAPKEAAPGKPWIWRAMFFDHRPEVDVALLAKGFHLAYIDVGNTFGCPDAMAHWDVLYKELTGKYGFASKAALEGLSRGGLYCFNWAAANPDKVSCIYADAPVCDFKSWPGGKGKGKGSPGDWAKLLKDYHFKDEAEALAYPKNPVDNLKPLADAGIPLLHVCGDADDVVPMAENTAIIKERYEKLGGKITVILKKGVGHKHGLDDPTPIIDFILANTPGMAAAKK